MAASSAIAPLRGWQGGIPTYVPSAEEAASARCAALGSSFEMWGSKTSSPDSLGHEVKRWQFKCVDAVGSPWKYVRQNAYCPAPRGWYWDNSGVNSYFCRISSNGSEDETDTQTGCKTENPISLASGTKIQREVDYRLNDLFHFTRYYRHRAVEEGAKVAPVLDALHGRWTHNFTRALEFTSAADYVDASSLPGHIFVSRPDGREMLFMRQGTTQTWHALAAENMELTHQTNGQWELRNSKNEVELYSSEGQLQQIRNRAGYAVDLAYSANAITVTDTYGKSLTIALDAKSKALSLTTPSGDQVAFSYNADGMLSDVAHPDLSTRQYTYESSGEKYLTGIVNENSDTPVAISYSNGGLTVEEDLNVGRGHVAAQVIKSANQTELVDQLGKKTVYTYDVFNGQKKVVSIDSHASTHCPAAASTYEYSDDGHLEAKVDWEGNRTEYVRDTLGRITSQTVGAGTAVARTTTTTWHAQWSKPTQRVEPGRTTDYTFDANGNVATRTVTDTATSETRTWTYNTSATGQLLSMDGPRTDVTDTTTFTYYNCSTGTQCGQQHTATNALGHVTTFNSYDAHGNVLSVTDANGVVTTLTYDLRQRLLTSTVDSSTTAYTYDGVGNITRVTSADGSYLQYTWDQANRLVAIEDALANRMEWDLDAVDNRTATRYKDPSGSIKLNQQQVFDKLSRLIKTVYAVSGEASYGYDKNSNRTSSVEPGGATTTSAYDALDRLISSTDADQGVTGYGYDALDHLTTVTDPSGNTTTYTTNAFGDVLQLQSPDTGTTTYIVDAAGNRTSETDARGVTVNYAYDALNRLTAKTYPDSSLNVTYTFDQGANSVGRLSSVTDSTGSLAYSYDGRGNTTEQRSTIGGVLYTTGYAYDAANKLTRTTYASGRTLDYGYDTAGRLSSITHVGDGATETLISNAQYLPFGPMTGYTLGNGAGRSMEYDLDYRIGRIADGTILDRSYAYSAANNISSITDTLAPANTQLFGYDDLNRLTSASGDYGSLGYAYDAVGNRQSFTDDQGSQSYSYSASSNRLTDVAGTSRSRDAVGNLTSTNGNSFSYSDQNRLSGVSGLAGTIDYGHNALGQRVSKTANGTTRHYLFDTQGQLIGEANSDGAEPVEYAYLNGQPLTMWRTANGGGTTGNALTAGQGDSGSLGLKEWKHFTLVPSTNARSATITMSGLTDDGDLYLKLGGQADDKLYDCKSDNGGTSTESCTIAVPENATLHIAMHGWAATDYSLSTAATDTGGGTGGGSTGGEITAGQSTSSTLSLQEWHHYTLAPSTEARSATITFSGLTGDGDLYVKLGSPADASSFDCKSDNGGTSTESCTIDVPANQTLHIDVHGYAATDYTLSTTATNTGTGGGTGGTGGGSTTALTLNQAVNDNVAVQTYKHYTLAPASAARSITVTMAGLTGDGDLYLRFGQQADNATFDCKSDNGGTSSEMCQVSLEANVELHIAVHGYAATDYVLTAGGQ